MLSDIAMLLVVNWDHRTHDSRLVGITLYRGFAALSGLT